MTITVRDWIWQRVRNICLVRYIPTGGYAVRRGWLCYSYLDRKETYWWSKLEYVQDYALFGTYDEAQFRRDAYIYPKPAAKKPRVWERVE